MDDYKFSFFNYQLKSEIDILDHELKALEEGLRL